MKTYFIKVPDNIRTSFLKLLFKCSIHIKIRYFLNFIYIFIFYFKRLEEKFNENNIYVSIIYKNFCTFMKNKNLILNKKIYLKNLSSQMY